MNLVIDVDDPQADDVRALLQRHLEFALRNSPVEHVHALDVDSLLDPAVTFFSARIDGAVLGVGAIRHLDAWHGELKSMHTLESARGRGVARAMVDHLLALAADRGYQRVSLETGTGPAFAPAQALYARVGFRPCPPFGEYTVNPHSVCMAKDL
jgi:putative acetyltransferase